MFFIVQLEQYQALIIYGLLGLAAVALYFFAVRSRKKYHCPKCKEEITTEYLNAEQCSICGTKLEVKPK
jgi:rRNA maturation endonuclease Nob1